MKRHINSNVSKINENIEQKPVRDDRKINGLLGSGFAVWTNNDQKI